MKSMDRAERIHQKTISLNKNFRIKTKPAQTIPLRNSQLLSGQTTTMPAKRMETLNRKPVLKKQEYYEEIFNPENPKNEQTYKLERNYPLLPEQPKYLFFRKSERTLPANLSIEKGQNGESYIDDRDCIGNFGLYLTYDKHSKNCWTNGEYNSRKIRVEKGTFLGMEAYRVHSPQINCLKHLVCWHGICFRFPQKRDYEVYYYCYDPLFYYLETLKLVTKVPKESVKPGEWNLLEENFEALSNPYIYFFVPAGQFEGQLNPFTYVGKGVQGATRHKDSNIIVELTRYEISEQCPYAEEYYHGPSSCPHMYPRGREFLLIANPNPKKEYLMWCNKKTFCFYLTQIEREKLRYKNTEIKGKTNGYLLAGACGNGQDELYYIEADQSRPKSKTSTNALNLVRCNLKGEEICRQSIDTSKECLDMNSFKACQIAYCQGKIAAILIRQMTIASDGLNHQSASVAIFDSKSLHMIKYVGTTTSHSFAITLFANKLKPGLFLGMDLGDGSPRGINVWQFDTQSYKSKVVYTFKAEHGDKPTNPAGTPFPEYKQASRLLGKTYYKWSNDNNCYTELAAPGIINLNSGNIIIFAGQNSPSSHDSSKVGTFVNVSRNVGFVKTSPDLNGPILSQGVSQAGGFYNFRGKWLELSHVGIKWLTNFTNLASATKIKAVNIKGKVFILYEYYEERSYHQYVNTQYMLLDEQGNILIERTVLPFIMRLHKEDDIYSCQNSIIVYTGQQKKWISRYEILINPEILA